MAIKLTSTFRALTGHEPFRWQQRLFDEFERGGIPRACDIPTGLGKTSVMAIWLAALDLRESNPLLPRRLIYVVDRRAVVDQATEEAQKLADRIGGGHTVGEAGSKDGKPDPLADVRDRLGLKSGQRLAVSTLRGQYADNQAWLDDPSAPAIVVGTVDMIGSRLLFSGYGVSRGRRPVHAAFLGADALIVLDEAHLVPPFQSLIEQVEERTRNDSRRAAAEAVVAPFKIPPMQTMALSATGRPGKGAVFSLQDEDIQQDDTVRQRVDAPKWLKLEDVPAGNLAQAMADRAFKRAGGRRRVLIFCNSRKVAEGVYEQLRKALGNNAKPRVNLELIVGARRVRERELLAESAVFRRFVSRPKDGEDVADGPAFLVATSAGEVGVDLDAQDLVCDLVAWERMVQRLGRVNRLGKCTESLIDVFAAIPEKDAETTPGTPTLEQCRAPFDGPAWQPRADDRRDASPYSLRQLRGNADFKTLAATATTGEPLRPALTDEHLFAWSMTSLAEHTGRADVAPWIRGWVDEEDPKTLVLWRRHLPILNDDRIETAKHELMEFLEEAPPHLSEVLETETHRVADMLRARAKAVLKGNAAQAKNREAANQDTVEEGGTDDSDIRPLKEGAFVAVVLADDRSVDRLIRLGELAELDAKRLHFQLSGRVVVLDARLGGLTEYGLLDPKSGAVPATLDGKVVEKIAEEGGTRLWSEERLRQIGFRVRVVKSKTPEIPAAETPEQKAKRMRERLWRRVHHRRFDDEAADGFEWRVEDWIGDGMAEGEMALARTERTVCEHHQDAARHAALIAGRLHLPPGLCDMLVTAAANHDWGKARTIWQRYAGNPGFARDPKKYPPLAKFTTRGDPNVLKVGSRTYRHEFGSIRDTIEKKVLDHLLTPGLGSLALHLIATHHGHARPVIFAYDEQDRPGEESCRLAEDLLRDFGRLQAELGPWGLAWFESLLRAADVKASRELELEADDNDADAAVETR